MDILTGTIYPSLDASIGFNLPPKKEDKIETASQFKWQKHEYWDFAVWNARHQLASIIESDISTNQAKIDLVLGTIATNSETVERRRIIDAMDSGIDALSNLFDEFEAETNESACLKVLEVIALLDKEQEMQASEKPQEFFDTKVKNHAKRMKRGSKGMTGYGRKMVRSGLSIIQKTYSKKNLSFVTLTIPTVSKEIHQKICSQWSEIVRQYFQELRRLLKRKGLSDEYVQVTEIQTKRLENSGIYAPHLHYVHQGRKGVNEHWRISKNEVRELWQRILENIAECEIDCSTATRIESVKKDVVRYMSKYMSKGNQSLQLDISQEMIPSAWWGIDKVLRQKIKASIIRISGCFAMTLFYNAKWFKQNGYLSYYYYVTITDSNGDDKRVGMSFKFKDEDKMKELLIIFQT